MNGYDLYCTYQSIKLHFTSEQYNFFHYEGKTRVSVDAFEKRRDKYFFHRLARKYSESEIIGFLVSNFVHNESQWSRSLLEPRAQEIYNDWKKTTESMSEIFKNDLEKLADNIGGEFNKNSFDSLFQVKEGQHPLLLTIFLQKEITIETMVILNNILGFISSWDKNITENIIYPKVSLKIRKYGSFLTVDDKKYKKILRALLLGETAI